MHYLDDCDDQTDHFDEWFDDQPDQSTAAWVTVPAGGSAGGIDASLTPLRRPVPPPSAKDVSLRANRNRVRPGKKVTFTARVSPCGGHEGDVIELYRGARLIATKPSNTLCAAIFRVKVQRKGRYTAASPRQDDDHVAGTSAPVKVKLKKR